MERFIIALKDISKRSFLLERLTQLDFIALKTEKQKSDRVVQEEAYDLFQSAGLFTNRNRGIDANQLPPKKRAPFTSRENEPSDYNLRDLYQRLRMYKKRYARHLQIKIANDRYGRPTKNRTLQAIDNNATWIKHYEQLILEAQKEGNEL